MHEDTEVSEDSSRDSKRFVPEMFDRIAPTYDLLNHVLSMGQDWLWRRRAAGRLDDSAPLHVLDLATGTGDMLIATLRARRNVYRAVGLDVSENMLALCRRKLQRRGLDTRAELVRGPASATPFCDNSFDAVTMAFGIRNACDVPGTLDEIRRVLAPGGRAVILEFSLPENRVACQSYLVYLRHIVPRFGALVSGDGGAYRYLDESIEAFYRPDAFRAALSEAGFSQVAAQSVTFGVATIYTGSKSREGA
jgi:demethylmenaquinone methyltransferase/2-methoxy-6-polyprenyl-1,4-benzoquinol methylase